LENVSYLAHLLSQGTTFCMTQAIKQHNFNPIRTLLLSSVRTGLLPSTEINVAAVLMRHAAVAAQFKGLE
jgi:hypothetical protein